jgi:hypothetical protein
MGLRSAEERGELGLLVERAEIVWGLGPLRPGYNEQLRGRCMRTTLDPLGGRCRPLFLYLGAQLAWGCAARMLRRQGFTQLRVPAPAMAPHEAEGELRLWHRPAGGQQGGGSAPPPPPPVVFCHGVGGPAALSVLGTY